MLKVFYYISVFIISFGLFAENVEAKPEEKVNEPVVQKNEPKQAEPNAIQPISNTEVKPENNFQVYTGKIERDKVRLRIKPDLESPIVRQFKKNDMVLVIGENENFWKVKAPSNLKLYVFRSYVIDNVVEANRVNLRLQPNVDSPIVAQLQKGDKIQGEPLSSDNKWLEITPLDNICFYISKEYVTKAGDENYLAFMEKRKGEVEKLLNSAYFITQAECKKPFNEMAPEEAIKQFDTIIKEYPDFFEEVQQAKEGLALLQDNYLQKKIAYLESSASVSQNEKDQLLSSIENAIGEQAKSKEEMAKLKTSAIKKNRQNLTNKMRFWQTIEESLYLSWTTFHPEKTMDDFYNEQAVNAITLSGVVENYNHTVNHKPGDYVIKTNDLSSSFLYSTKINLEEYVGKKVSISVSPRPNNNFAFPAYFVNSIE
ncbi:MAG: SH3 domain-containing protein [Chlamydiae bacterium]|nr:SH3 domain-containing protein [Chlamydiota bacterium]